MREFVEINARNLYKAVYEACCKANIQLPEQVYNSLQELRAQGLEPQEKMSKIFSNTYIADKNQRPLCQDTGQIIVFVQVGAKTFLDNGLLSDVINSAISECYNENFFRKSIVKDAFFNRKNTNNNTPAIIYTDIVNGDKIKIDILIKGGGAENMSKVEMLNPSATEDDIINFVTNCVTNAGENACPPLFLGIGIGGTIDKACVLSKKAFFENQHKTFSDKLKKHINSTSTTKVADIGILSSSTHIASLPVCVSINCHSTRHASVLVDKTGYKILTKFSNSQGTERTLQNVQKVHTSEIEKLKNLQIGSEIYLSGVIYTARDMAHKKLVELLENGKNLPFELKNSIIFYAGPCPRKTNEIIGPVGPTTSKRMDKFAPILYENGLLATIGKGARSCEVKDSITKNNALYFSIQGGVASLLQDCVKDAKIICFEDLGAEAIFKLEVENLPIKLELK